MAQTWSPRKEICNNASRHPACGILLSPFAAAVPFRSLSLLAVAITSVLRFSQNNAYTASRPGHSTVVVMSMSSPCTLVSFPHCADARPNRASENGKDGKEREEAGAGRRTRRLHALPPTHSSTRCSCPTVLKQRNTWTNNERMSLFESAART
ncbi:hypothetical protein IWX49DRAFT_158036 [Phyllosticta citricarpa]